MYYTDLPQRKEYNKSISKLPQSIAKLQLLGNQYLVRQFKFTKPPTSSKGILDDKRKQFETEGGKSATRRDENPFQLRGIILKIPNQLQQHATQNNITPGTIVWIAPQAFHPHNQFIPSRVTAVSDYEGFLKVSPSLIEAIEPQ